MNRRMRLTAYAALLAAALGIACLVLRQQPAGQQATITMLDIGQGDSFLIQAPNGAQLLIDGGPNETVLSELAKALPPGDRSIDVVIATHPDADHIGGLPLVLSRYHVGLFLTTQAASDSETYRTLMQAIADRGIPAYYARHGMSLLLDEGSAAAGEQHPRTTFAILFPDRETTGWETNTASVVGRLQIDPAVGVTTAMPSPCCSALFTGDSPASVETFLAAAIPKDVDVDILKLGHHGSKTSSSEAFLRAASPALAIISAGINNRYGHPAPETIARLRSLSIPFVSTQDTGAYSIKSDGNNWSSN